MHQNATYSGSPRLNEPAPDFQVKTTHGPRSLQDYAGRWLVLFSHPADFTPVCTTEFIGFARAHSDFLAEECDLLGLSIDSNFSHIAWLNNIEEKFGVRIEFPVIDDVSMKVAHAYGMIQPGESDTSAVRCTFVIDPDGMLRAMIYYPMSTGRSIAEVLRLVRALRATTRHKMVTPEGWQPGDDGIVPPPQTIDAARQRNEQGGCTTWYFQKQGVDES